MEKKIIAGVKELDFVINYIMTQMEQCSVITFLGSLGAGKTTLIKKLLKKCGVDTVITSPTFTYMNRYQNKKNDTFYHFDCYRIKSENEFVSLGFDEYLDQESSWSLIEWPEVIESLLQEKKVCKVFIDYVGQDKRVFIIKTII